MKKFFLLFTLMLLVFNSSYSVSKIMPETDWKKMNLKGRVMKMVRKVHKYDENGKNESVKEVTFIFNRQGYITTEINEGDFSLSHEYDKNGYLIRSVDDHGIEHEYEYEYDENRNLVRTKRTKYQTYRELEKTIYNKEGKIIRTQTYTQNQYDKEEIKITDDNNYFKDKDGELYQSLSDYSYVYNKAGKFQEIRDNVFSSGTIKYIYESKNDLDIKIIETSTRKIVTYYDKEGNELYSMWITQPSSYFGLTTEFYLIFKDTKRDKYGNLTYQVANRAEVEDVTKVKDNDAVIYEKRVIEYEYYN